MLLEGFLGISKGFMKAAQGPPATLESEYGLQAFWVSPRVFGFISVKLMLKESDCSSIWRSRGFEDQIAFKEGVVLRISGEVLEG